jgi:hypothetical protein
VDLNPNKLQAYNIAPQEVANAINQQSVVLPSGTAKIGKREYDVLINGSTDTIEASNKDRSGSVFELRRISVAPPPAASLIFRFARHHHRRLIEDLRTTCCEDGPSSSRG